ncbi:hypothetical protein C3941_23330 [Kaistia algarum]|uniref:hypothetical protein n=1 Tax=Kaistia algarum TaxID=2083279 RepID=UPI000CE892B5|nr:hypothetical protein [Kaistia algarum]PPE77503.1 hypothetical protein C3941_23330 [Kaistia algarum]
MISGVSGQDEQSNPDATTHGDLLLSLNKLTNDLIASAVSVDDSPFLPVNYRNWCFPSKSDP